MRLTTLLKWAGWTCAIALGLSILMVVVSLNRELAAGEAAVAAVEAELTPEQREAAHAAEVAWKKAEATAAAAQQAEKEMDNAQASARREFEWCVQTTFRREAAERGFESTDIAMLADPMLRQQVIEYCQRRQGEEVEAATEKWIAAVDAAEVAADAADTRSPEEKAAARQAFFDALAKEAKR